MRYFIGISVWLLVVLIAFSYCSISRRSDLTFRGQRFVEFGWPLEYTSATVSPDAVIPLPFGQAFDTRPFALIADLVVASAVVLIIFVLWKAHFYINNGRIWSFRLTELLAIFILASVSLAGYRKMHQNYLSDLKILETLDTDGGWRVGTTNENLAWYLEPIADIGMITRENWLYLSATYETSPHEDIDFAYASSELLDALAAGGYRTAFVHVVLVSDPSIDDKDVCNLSRLFGSCRHLELIDTPLITSESLRHIDKNFKGLESLSMLGTQIKEGDLERLIRAGALSGIKIEVEEGSG